MADDPQWMRDLARAARDRRDADAGWDSETDEQGPTEEADARASGDSSADSAADRRELMRPPSDARREEMVEAALRGFAVAPHDNVVSLGAKRSGDAWKWTAAALVLVAAAASFFLFFYSGNDQPMPSYALEVTAGVASARGEPATGPLRRVTEGGLIELVLRPEQETEVTPALVVFAVQGERVVRIDPDVERDQRGAMRVRVVLGVDVELGAGVWKWVIALGAKGALPDAASARALASAPGAHRADLQVLVAEFEIERDVAAP